jgi:enterochelin esterase-like enzyme
VTVVAEREALLTVDDPRRELRAVRLHAELWKRKPAPEFSRVRDGTWQLRLQCPPTVDRLEYRLELVSENGTTQIRCDPQNPLRAATPFGDVSVLEFPGYEPPSWIRDTDAPRGSVRGFDLASRTLRARVRGQLWSSAGAGWRLELPMLLVHDGPEYAEYSSLLRLLDWAVAERELPPVRAALLAPVDRDEDYSASARYAEVLATELVPGLTRLAPTLDGARVGMGTSLGALAMLHAHRLHPDLFRGLFLQSGSFFRRRLDPQEGEFRRFARITRFTTQLDRTPSWSHAIPVSLTCGLGEENLASNRATRDTLSAQGYPVTLYEHADAHNWVSWRDALHPSLVTLLGRLWR